MKRILLIAIFAIFSSCSENIDIGNSFEAELSTQFEKTILLCGTKKRMIYQIIDKESKFTFSKDLLNNLIKVKSKNELNKLLTEEGLMENKKIIDLYLEILELGKNFEINNPLFYKLSIEERNVIIGEVCERIYKRQEEFFKLRPNSCASEYYKDMRRCGRNDNVCIAGAIAASLEGGVPGIIALMFCTYNHYSCNEDAQEDYQDCNN